MLGEVRVGDCPDVVDRGLPGDDDNAAWLHDEYRGEGSCCDVLACVGYAFTGRRCVHGGAGAARVG